MDLLFVYGTLRDRTAHPMARYVWRRAASVGPGYFQGRMYQVTHYPGAVASDNPADQVAGLLLRLKPRAESTLRQLDAYEGYDPNHKAASLFVRDALTVTDVRGQPRQAWIYLYTQPVAEHRRIMSGDFFKP